MNASDIHGMTPLRLAVAYGYLEIMQASYDALLRFSASVLDRHSLITERRLMKSATMVGLLCMKEYPVAQTMGL